MELIKRLFGRHEKAAETRDPVSARQGEPDARISRETRERMEAEVVADRARRGETGPRPSQSP
jgi:hypothetical protein